LHPEDIPGNKSQTSILHYSSLKAKQAWPRDFDTTQPIINELSLIRKFKSYVGLRGAESKLEKWLSDFEFTDMGNAIQKIDWENVPVVEI